jgi:enamine deaminase RidA (YjgF/YER057c/UK114 family)
LLEEAMSAKQRKDSQGAPLSRRSVMTSAAAAAAGTGLIAAAGAQTGAGEKPAPNVRFVQPEAIYKTATYTHVVEIVGPGRLIYTSGEQGRDRNGDLPSDIRAQSIQLLENIKAALAAVGATFDNVIKVNVYMLDLRKHQPIWSEVKQQYVNKNAPPASTTVQVSALTREGALLEVEVVAALPA